MSCGSYSLMGTWSADDPCCQLIMQLYCFGLGGQMRKEVKPFVFLAEATGNCRGGQLFPSSLPDSLADLIIKLT